MTSIFIIGCGSIGERHLRCFLSTGRWGVLRHGEQDWAWHLTPPLQRDELFNAQAVAFLEGINGRSTAPWTFKEAVQTLKFNEAALRSTFTQHPVTRE